MIDDFKVLICNDISSLTRLNSQTLANDLSLSVVDESFTLQSGQASFEYKENVLAINLLLDNKITPMFFDLTDGAVGFRAVRANQSSEVIAKAIGCKPHYRPRVLDATAGMGRDALIMAMLGCEVIMHERNFAIYQLLNNALKRLKQNKAFSEVGERLQLVQKNSIDLSNNAPQKIEEVKVVYLDPMFPDRKKSALVKKEMRLFKLLAGEDNDADQLLKSAMQSPAKRIVVKRPKSAPMLQHMEPSHQILAKKFRYDIYLK